MLYFDKDEFDGIKQVVNLLFATVRRPHNKSISCTLFMFSSVSGSRHCHKVDLICIEHVYLSACCIVCTAMPVVCAAL